MKSEDIRKAFFEFMTEPPRKHKVIANVSLVPVNDPTLLFVNSGMFPLVPYLLGQKHPSGTRLCNFQRCLRTKQDEVEEIGDNRHTLMFEMMGNWSLNDYFKEEQIPWMLELYVERFQLDPHRIYVSVWGGNKDVPRDDEAITAWKKAFKKYNIDAEFSPEITNIPKDLERSKNFPYRIFPYGADDNWWLRAEAPGELGGPTTELFYDTGNIERKQDSYHINDDSGRFIEVGNSVFMQYKLSPDMVWERLEQANVDFGGGFERVVMCAQQKNDIFETDLYADILKKIAEISGKEYKTDNKENKFTSHFRVLADHIRAATFIIADGIIPSNKDQGYMLRRLIRRMIRRARYLELDRNFSVDLAQIVIDRFRHVYPHLEENADIIINELAKEEIKFVKTLSNGLKELQKFTGRGKQIDGTTAFYLYETYGFPIEMIIEELSSEEINDSEDFTPEKKELLLSEFNQELAKHREQSRAGAEKKFKGGLADHSEATTMLHTTHHLLLAALQQVLGKHVKQKGSNITSERLRIDISHDQKLSDQEVEEIEKIVNEQIKADLVVSKEIMPKAEAEKIGAEMEFGQKYGDLVTVYFIKDPKTGAIFSKEFCGGPHIEHTGQLQELGTFKILKQENIGSGVRRIKASLIK